MYVWIEKIGVTSNIYIYTSYAIIQLLVAAIESVFLILQLQTQDRDLLQKITHRVILIWWPLLLGKVAKNFWCGIMCKGLINSHMSAFLYIFPFFGTQITSPEATRHTTMLQWEVQESKQTHVGAIHLWQTSFHLPLHQMLWWMLLHLSNWPWEFSQTIGHTHKHT